jgi:hypothetical protein
MKTINSKIENVKEDSKIKKTFKKLKNAFVVGTAALMITCGGSEIDTTDNGNKSPIPRLPDYIEAYADEINLKDTYDVSNHLQYSADLEMNPLFPVYVDFCSKTYDSVEIKYSEGIRASYYDIEGTTSIKEFLFKTKTNEFPEILDILKGDEYTMMRIEERARPPPGFYYDFNVNNYDLKRYYAVLNVSVFRYLLDDSVETIKATEPPAVILCYARYNDDWIKQYISFGRMVVVPYNEFMDKSKEVMTEEEIFEKISR